MKTKYKLTIGAQTYEDAKFSNILAIGEANGLDLIVLGEQLAQMQIGKQGIVQHFDGTRSYLIEISQDHRASDLFTALQSLDPTPKHNMRSCALRAIAIAIGNAEDDESRLKFQILHTLFLSI